MEKGDGKTALYKVIKETDGYRYQFFCGLSELAVCTTDVYPISSNEDSLSTAWEKEGKKYFNQCRKCGKWVCDVMYNADVLECVACAPWEDTPSYCPKCGELLPSGDAFCRKCGAQLQYWEA